MIFPLPFSLHKHSLHEGEYYVCIAVCTLFAPVYVHIAVCVLSLRGNEYCQHCCLYTNCDSEYGVDIAVCDVELVRHCKGGSQCQYIWFKTHDRL